MKIAAIVILVLLAGSGTVPSPTQSVYVPLRAPCVTDAPARSVYEFGKLPLHAPAGGNVLALARHYKGQSEAVIAGCR